MGLGLFRRRGTLIRNYAIVEHNKKNVFRRTFSEDRPRLKEVFLAIIELLSFAETINSIILKYMVFMNKDRTMKWRIM